MCMTTKLSKYHAMLADTIGVNQIYSCDFNGGTLYALIHTNPEKMHSTVDNCICSLDKMLQNLPCNTQGTTLFMSISDILSGKVKTFAAGENLVDEHYNVIFDTRQPGTLIGRKHNIRPGVYKYPEDPVPEDSFASEQEDIRVQERVMAENPRDFNQEPAYDTGDDDDAGGSAQMPRGRCDEFLKRPAEVSVSPPAKRYHHGEVNALFRLKDAEINALRTSMAKDAEINALKTSIAIAAKDKAIEARELSKAIDTKDTALSAAADAKKHAQQVEADKNNEIRALMQKLDAATAEINRRKTIEETVQVVNAVMNESVVAVRTLAVELCKDNAEKMEVRDEAMAKRMEVRDEAMAKRMDSVEVSHQQHAEMSAKNFEPRTPLMPQSADISRERMAKP